MGLKRRAVALCAWQKWALVERTIDKVAIVDLNDFVSGIAEVGKDILQSAEKTQVCYFGTELFSNFSHDREFARFTEFNSPAQGSTVALAFNWIMCLVHKDTTVMAKNAKRERPNALLRHIRVTLGGLTNTS